MKKVIFIFAIILTALTSCEKEEVTIATSNLSNNQISKGFVIENGYIKFDNINAYMALYESLSGATEAELNKWNVTLPFKSLEVKYNENKTSDYISDSNSNETISPKLNTNRLNSVLASMFNDKGVLVINDTILKIKNEYLYTITNGDFALLDEIENDSDLKDDNVLRTLHTIRLKETNNSEPEGLQKSIDDRTLVFYTSKKTREHVTFEAYLSGGFIRFEMKGWYQYKGWFGWELFPDASPMVYAQINANGTHGDNNVNTNNPAIENVKALNIGFYVGSNPTVPFNLNVTFSYKKTNSKAYIHEWEGTETTTAGTYSRNYNWQQF
jgi:hypothetical protein